MNVFYHLIKELFCIRYIFRLLHVIVVLSNILQAFSIIFKSKMICLVLDLASLIMASAEFSA